ncbi:MAG: triphosphoribosyl-dephospho-CoA synthase, partial [Muribaculaceae bacterium]|nr:triphosphoribosyl-dephospho-CoA synthase [Muribaculaceae bacterium]
MLQPAGLSGERLMLEANGGVNTHKGALFSIGLAVSAVAYLIYKARLCGNQAGTADILSLDSISSVISVIAQTFSRPDGTHGASVRSLHDVPTALDMAVGGYAPVFGSWRRISDPYRRLLLIMSELEDSNIYHRGGKNGADFIRKRSAELLSLNADGASAEVLTEALASFNVECVDRWLSPGGAADMLALSFFIDSLTEIK